ncbi:hypothetical protein SAMN05444920_102294 [Nonomuraea solani]|uniref:Uncharacterized protein n=1 Tax=Nonomuraea solani TaxID=1144553 RepID=A0A1H5YII9_9ACTN|nr:hypothetical protein SAMN05444920_102294 [Nonomuraea solani]
MSQAITYVITYENGRWVSRCPTGETEGVGVAGSLSQMERDLAEIHAWAWPENTPGVEFVFDLPEEVAEVVIEYRHERNWPRPMPSAPRSWRSRPRRFSRATGRSRTRHGSWACPSSASTS